MGEEHTDDHPGGRFSGRRLSPSSKGDDLLLGRLCDLDQLLGPLVAGTKTMSDGLSDAVSELADALDTLIRRRDARTGGGLKTEIVATARARMKVLAAIGAAKDE